MVLPGRLCNTTLGDLLGALYRARVTGTLELIETATTGRSHRVHFDGGLVEQVDTPFPAPRIGEILHREGFLNEPTLRVFVRRAIESPGRPLGEILIEARATSVQALGAALRHQQRARLDALFSLGDARVRFHVAGARRGRALELPLSPREFLHGRQRRRDSPSAAPQRPNGAARPSLPRVRHDPARARALRVLGLDDGANREAVRRAFRARALKLHPDRFPGASASERAHLMRRFAELSAAYHALVA